jgi:cytochrome c5
VEGASKRDLKHEVLPKPPQGPSGLPLLKPPYGRITALDLNKGEKLWTVPNGDGPRNHPLLKDLNLPPLGEPGRAAPLLTKTLLFLGEASDAVAGRHGSPGPRKFRAYDKASGQVVWKKELPAGATGAPITYLAGGRQFIVVPIGGRTYGAAWVALAIAPQSEAITLTTTTATGDDGATATPAIYTEVQAKRGEAIFREKCLTCHLESSWGPPLRGDAFWSVWNRKPARPLYSTIISTMPLDSPGTLTPKDCLDLVAYILRLNGLPSGDREMESADQLNAIRLVRPR